MAKRGSKARTGTVKTGQAEIDRQLDEQYAQTAVAWWDVRRPEVYFGIKGERTDEQKDLARRFRQEWGNVRGGAVLNGLVDGTYTADQVTDYWGTENFNSLIKAEGYQIEEFTGTADEFGAYLASQWDNISEFLGGTATGPDGTLGSISAAPMQGMGGPKGAERGVSVTADRITQQEYVNAIRAAAEQAGIPIGVSSPDGAQYELNYGQFDDVALGEYKQTEEPYDALDIAGQIFSTVIETILTTAVTGQLFSTLSKIPQLQTAMETIGGVYRNGVLAFSPETMASLQQGLAEGQNLTTILSSAFGIGLNSFVTGAIKDELGLRFGFLDDPNTDSLNVVEDILSGSVIATVTDDGVELTDVETTTQDEEEGFPEDASENDIIYNEAGDGFIFKDGIWQVATQEDLDAPEAIDTTQDEEEVVSLEADEDLMGTTEEVAVTQELPPEAEVFEGESTRVIDPIGEVGGTVTVTEVDSGDPFFQPETVPDTTPDDVEIEEVGYEVTDPEVDLELDPILPEQPTVDDAGGGGGSQESADSSQDAVDSSQDPETTDLEQAIAGAGAGGGSERMDTPAESR